MSAQTAASSPNTAEDLARFREEWKEEVRRKKAAAHAGPSKPEGPSDTAPSQQNGPEALQKDKSPDVPQTAVHPAKAYHPVHVPRFTDTTSAPLGPKLQRAVEVYRRAVLCEQQSNLDEALALYRTAFRMDSNVDRAYHKIEAQFYVNPIPPAAQKPGQASSSSKRHSLDDIVHNWKALDVHSAVVQAKEGDAVPQGSLASIMTEWPHDLEFLPEDEREPAWIQRLPIEVLLVVLRKLDTTTLERFALVSRRARALTIDTSIWREFVEAIYKPPQLPDIEELAVLLNDFQGDHRRLYIEQPRIRLDGVYIAICHYTRTGVSETSWINPVHMVQYHRFLRFYPDGQVISLLSLAEPREIIPILKPTLHIKGLSLGSWRLTGTTVHIESLIDPRPSGSTNRHAFQMTLELRSRPLGRWNRLNFLAYDSVNLESGKVSPVPLKHDRGYHFSKVRSY
ncbi:uncharacterized protein C8Q71DRAFT_746458 [Rhodofomes roseus]|uniref:F-box only protein 9 n=1 Tax=Rhodofomes roseus TaxID=34475 RepID=A0ABQ8KPU9_9APHY|nr:uncharacterized protein C8Q71DRAFT_746458 [Rhodofomes roseus]KAH9840249.1 hypothetical protein C8Q71DRAFT_746458 [Rhodofomes roseus]